MGDKTTTKALQENVNKLYKIDKSKFSVIPNSFTKEQLQLLHTATPPEHIHQFPANAGKMAGLSFVTGTYMKHMLDRLTGGAWSFEIKEKGNTAGTIWVLGRLTITSQDGGKDIVKEQFGRAKIKYLKDTTDPVDIGNDMKAAATDALKKCASEVGIARDVYGVEEFIEAEVFDVNDVEDLPNEDDVPTETGEKLVVDDAYKAETTRLLLEAYPKQTDRMRYLKEKTGKIKLDIIHKFDWVAIRDDLTSGKLFDMPAEEQK